MPFSPEMPVEHAVRVVQVVALLSMTCVCVCVRSIELLVREGNLPSHIAKYLYGLYGVYMTMPEEDKTSLSSSSASHTLPGPALEQCKRTTQT